jgi:hypothetical protein
MGFQGWGGRFPHLFAGLELPVLLVVLANIDEESVFERRGADAPLVAELGGKG